jgi:hypothetical protein
MDMDYQNTFGHKFSFHYMLLDLVLTLRNRLYAKFDHFNKQIFTSLYLIKTRTKEYLLESNSP